MNKTGSKSFRKNEEKIMSPQKVLSRLKFCHEND